MSQDKADVVPLLAHEVLSRISKVMEKWSGWGINFRLLIHSFHHLSQEQIEGLAARTHKVVAVVKASETLRTIVKLIHKATIFVPETKEFVVREFFKMGKNGAVKVWMSERFQSVILAKAGLAISLPAHQIDVFQLSESMNDKAIRAELGQQKVWSPNGYLASIKTRIEMWAKKEVGHGLLDNGYANIDYVDLGDRIVVVYCSFDESDSRWVFYCHGLDGFGNWRGGFYISSSELGA